MFVKMFNEKQVILVILLQIFFCMPTNTEEQNNLLLTPKIYSKILQERRSEHTMLTKQMLQFKYEKNYKLLNVAYSQIFELLNANNLTLNSQNSQNYQPQTHGFPQQQQNQQLAVTLILENCCLAAETLLHFPEITYRIFKKTRFVTWKSTLNWCIDFVNAFPHIIDEGTAKLLELLTQEINEEQRTADYVNPYYAKNEENHVTPTVKQNKVTKKLKKGPQLSGGRHKEL